MIEITSEHIQQLIEIESKIQYSSLPPLGREPFTIINRDSSVLLSAPHGAITFRNSVNEIWHEEDEYTAGLALLVSDLCQSSVIATKFKNDHYDPNYVRDDNVRYKRAIRSMIERSGVKYVLDLHGAALKSPKLAPAQTIDLGYRHDSDHERSMGEDHILKLEQLFQAPIEKYDPSCFVVGRNKFPARGSGTITSFVFYCFGFNTDHKVQSVQIELKPQLRIARRFPSASLYKSCGEFEADPACIMHTLDVLVGFIEYLKG
ncbi:hypothetical protein ACFLUA_04750 [Chloroflexota bacterium]